MTSLPWKMRTNPRAMWRITTSPEGGPMARRRKRSNVAPRCGGTAASTVSPVGEAANRSASAPRRTAEPVGPDGPARREYRVFRVPARTATWPPTADLTGEVALHLRRCGPQWNRSVVGGLDRRANPLQSVSAPRRRRTPTTLPNGEVANRGVSAPRRATELRGGRCKVESKSPARRECLL